MSIQLGTRHVAEVRYRRCLGVGIYVITSSGKKRGVFLPENCWRELVNKIYDLNKQIEESKGERYTYGDPSILEEEAAVCTAYTATTDQSANNSTRQLFKETSTGCEVGTNTNDTKEVADYTIEWDDAFYAYPPKCAHQATAATPTYCDCQVNYWNRQPTQGSQTNCTQTTAPTTACRICKAPIATSGYTKKEETPHGEMGTICRWCDAEGASTTEYNTYISEFNSKAETERLEISYREGDIVTPQQGDIYSGGPNGSGTGGGWGDGGGGGGDGGGGGGGVGAGGGDGGGDGGGSGGSGAGGNGGGGGAGGGAGAGAAADRGTDVCRSDGWYPNNLYQFTTFFGEE